MCERPHTEVEMARVIQQMRPCRIDAVEGSSRSEARLRALATARKSD